MLQIVRGSVPEPHWGTSVAKPTNLAYHFQERSASPVGNMSCGDKLTMTDDLKRKAVVLLGVDLVK